MMDCLWSELCENGNACALDERRWDEARKRYARGCAPWRNRQLPGMSPHGLYGELLLGFLFDFPQQRDHMYSRTCGEPLATAAAFTVRNLLACRHSSECVYQAKCRLERGECQIDPERYRQVLQREPPEVQLHGPPPPAPVIFSAAAARGFVLDLVSPLQRWLESRAPCADTSGCFELGLCSPEVSVGPSTEGRACRATRVIDCLFSTTCREHGACRPEEGRCVRGGDQLFGRVTPNAEEHDERLARDAKGHSYCAPASNMLECRHSHGCAQAGTCYFDGRKCVAGSDTGCRQSAGCRDGNMCRFDATARCSSLRAD